MDLSTLKDQIKDQLNEIWDRIQESSLYIELREKFELLPSRMQKLIIVLGVAITGLFLISFPYGNLSESWLYEEQFEENRTLIRDLLRASSTLKETSPLPNAASAAMIESRVRQVLQEVRLTPEQIGNIQAVPNAKTKLANAAVDQEAISVQVRSLNLRQVTELSHRLQSLGAGIQPVSFQMQRTTGQTHYYDVIFRVFQFALNVGADEAQPPGRPAGARGGR